MTDTTTIAIANDTAGPPAPAPGWDSFEKDLAAALSVLDDECLVISTKAGHRFVQFHASAGKGVFAEAVSNGYLQPSEKLDDGQVASLLELGWSAPTHAPDAMTPVPSPAGSPNFFRAFPSPPSCAEIARFAVRTLAEIQRVASPLDLEYSAFDEPGNPVTLPALHIDRHRPPAPRAKAPRRRTPSALARLRARVLAAARQLTGDLSLEYEDGDLSVRLGKRHCTLTPYGDPTFIRLYCTLVSDPEIDEGLLRRVHEVNARMALGRLILVPGGVFYAFDVPAAPFHAAHLAQVANFLARVADDVERDLCASGEVRKVTPTLN